MMKVSSISKHDSTASAQGVQILRIKRLVQQAMGASMSGSSKQLLEVTSD